MIGYIDVSSFSDGKKILLKTENGLGYEVNYAYYAQVGTTRGLYLSPYNR